MLGSPVPDCKKKQGFCENVNFCIYLRNIIVKNQQQNIMRKLLLLLSLFIVADVMAGPVGYEDAKKIAEEFAIKKNGAKKSLKYKTLLPKRANGTAADAAPPAYYIFDVEDNGGFVVVSGDDLLKPLLAYTESGSFSPDSVNPAVQWWLGVVEENVAAVRALQQSPALTKAAGNAGAVGPLLTTKWNQRYPYNLLCPVDNAHSGETSLTGCVATAMAQILNYYKYPERATGSVSYRTDYHSIAISENLENYVFDWEKMFDRYSDSTTDEEKNAVAELMYVCGVAVNADYCYYATSAFSSDCVSALLNNFGYKGVRQLSRSSFSCEEWERMVIDELNNGRPVYYSGTSASGGHAFVCDGYNAEGLFHINWGWGGSDDGYFELASMEYSRGQSIICGIDPEINETAGFIISVSDFAVPTVSEFKRTSINATMRHIANSSAVDFKGYFGVALVKDDDIKAQSFLGWSADLKPNYYYSSLSFTLGVPADVPDGEYRLVGVYKEMGSDEVKIMQSSTDNGNVAHLLVTLAGDKATISIPAGSENAALEVTAIVCPDVINASGDNAVTLTLRNNTSANFFGEVYINSQENFTGVYVPANSEKVYTINVTASADTSPYTLEIYSYNTVAGDVHIFTHEVEVYDNKPDFEADGIYYTIVSCKRRTVAVTHKGNSYDEYADEYTGDVTIPSVVTNAGIDYKVTGIADYAFRDCSTLASVSIPNGVTAIGNNAFAYCRGLTDINIPEGVTKIGDRSFFKCQGLARIDIPQSVTTIGAEAFWNSYSLQSIEIPNGVVSIGEQAFAYCYWLSEVIVSKTVKEIGDEAFMDCTRLKTVYNFSNMVFTAGSTEYGYIAYYADLVVNSLPGDVDGDSVVDVADVTKLVSIILGELSEESAADVDGDGVVDVADVTALVNMILNTD